MIKKVALVTACLFSALFVSARQLTPEEALSRIHQSSANRVRSIDGRNSRLAYTVNMENGAPAAYVFTNGANQGFAIASANDIAVPLIGYSDSDSFNADNIPSQLKWWLTVCARRIEYAIENNLSYGASDNSSSQDWEAIEPLCKTRWNQDAPYNGQAPTVGTTQCPTGCVATSLAQAMYYFKYPARGTGQVRYSWNGKTLQLNLAAKAIAWDSMLDQYVKGGYDDDEANAVAYLMKACGYSVQMNYSASSSGAQSYRLINALVNNFGYDPSVKYTDRNLYSSSDWAKMIYDNIKNVGPVIYDGTAIDGGHSFICDGYRGDGYFHFNWGWGGLSDGYYVLDVLNPESQGTGGATGGFNWGQNAVIGMQKPTGQPAEPDYSRMLQYGTTDASLQGNKLIWNVKDYSMLGWGNGSFRDISVQLGAIMENLSNNESRTLDAVLTGNIGSNITLSANSYYPMEKVHPEITLPSDLADGTYKITIASRDRNYEDAPWQPLLIYYGYSNYCNLKVENGQYSVINAAPASLSFEDFSFVNNVYYNKVTMMKGRVVNNSALDLTECIQPILSLNGIRQFVGDMMLVSADAGTSEEMQWIVQFHQLNGASFSPGTSYDFQILNKNTDQILGSYGKVKMDNVTGTLKIAVDKFGFTGSPQQTVTVGTRQFKNTYIVNDAEEIELDFDYSVTSGYLDRMVTVGLQWFNPETNAYEKVVDDLYSEHPFLAAGQSESLVIPISTKKLPDTGVFNVVASTLDGSKNVRLSSIFFAFNNWVSGVDDIITDGENAAVEYYNMMGEKILHPQKGDLLIKVVGGKSEKIIF